jgi:spore maturation protein CgeB
MRIAFFGSSLVSSYWNANASYYRGIVRALHGLGHEVTFFEPDVFSRQQNRDMDHPSWARVIVYRAEKADVEDAIESARGADLIVKASSVGAFDGLLDAGLLELKTRENVVIYWDVDATATLTRLASDPADPLRHLIPRFDAVFTSSGGDSVIAAYGHWGARECVPVYSALDPEIQFPEFRDSRYAGDVAFLGDRFPNRESRVDEFFWKPAATLPESSFLLGGSGWHGKARTPNIRYVGHVPAGDHNAFNSSSRALVHITGESEAECGYSPGAQLFEAAGAGACIITDAWDGIAQFFEPGEEILVANDGEEVAGMVQSLTWAQAEKIGHAAYERALWEHTYAHRAKLVEAFLEGSRLTVAGAMR